MLQTDASDQGVGTVLNQLMSDGKEHPIAYYSRKLLPREERYSTVEKDKPSVCTCLGGHCSLVWLDRLTEFNTRLARWSLALQPYQFTVTYRPGSSNGNADALSRAGQVRQTALSQEKGGGVSHASLHDSSDCNLVCCKQCVPCVALGPMLFVIMVR